MSEIDIGKELKAFSDILDATPQMLHLVYNDLIVFVGNRADRNIDRTNFGRAERLRQTILQQAFFGRSA